MALRTLLVSLIVAATAAFIVGTTMERNSRDAHSEKTEKPRCSQGRGWRQQRGPGAQGRRRRRDRAGCSDWF